MTDEAMSPLCHSACNIDALMDRRPILALTHFWCSFLSVARVPFSLIQRFGGITGDVP
jgi:hypothetical protein